MFWTLSYILFDPVLLKDLKKEIEPVFADSESPNVSNLFNSCPLLHSTCEEALRLTIWSMGVRSVTSPCTISGKTLQPGHKLLMPYRVMHFNAAVFGSHPEKFNPKRFMEDKDLAKSTSYRPFGGGSHLCPGRLLARREVQVFVAAVLHRFEIEVDRERGKEAKFPKMDDGMPSGGIQDPVKGERVLMRMRQI